MFPISTTSSLVAANCPQVSYDTCFCNDSVVTQLHRHLIPFLFTWSGKEASGRRTESCLCLSSAYFSHFKWRSPKIPTGRYNNNDKSYTNEAESPC